MAGQTSVEEGFKVGDAFEDTADNVSFRTGYGTQHRVVGTMAKGCTGTVISDGVRHSASANGYTWLNVSIPRLGSGWMAIGTANKAWFQKTTATSKGITTVNKSDFIFVPDVIEFNRQSPALQYSEDNAREGKAPYTEGERVIAAWIGKGMNGVWHYLFTGEDNEWVRVKYADTVRISDAPLLGDDTH